MLPEGVLQSRAAPCADPGCCHLDSRSRGWVMCSPRPAPETRSLAESEGEEREGARRRDPESHWVGGGGFPPQWPRGRGESRVPRLESRGWGNLHLSGGVGVLTRRKRGSPVSRRGRSMRGRGRGVGRVGGTPELLIVMGVDDNLTPSSLPSVWRTLGGRAQTPPDLL